MSRIFVNLLTFVSVLMSVLCFETVDAYADSFDVYMERCEPYRATIERILSEEGVPVEYFALMLAESGCDLDNLSDRGAKGAWQLMDATAKAYGVDDPNNLEQSTRGAARYLKSLISRFHTMEWVVAAYNAGGTNLKRVTGYPNADFIKVKKVRPEAYGLAMKVNGFVKRIKSYDRNNTLHYQNVEISVEDTSDGVDHNDSHNFKMDG